MTSILVHVSMKYFLMLMLSGTGHGRLAYAAPTPHPPPALSGVPLPSTAVCPSPIVSLVPSGHSCVLGTRGCVLSDRAMEMIEDLKDACRQGVQGLEKPCLHRVEINPDARQLRIQCGATVRED